MWRMDHLFLKQNYNVQYRSFVDLTIQIKLFSIIISDIFQLIEFNLPSGSIPYGIGDYLEIY